MPFIGILAKKNDGNFIKNEIIKKSENKRLDILNINQDNIENIRNIRFDAIVLNENIDYILDNSKYLEEIIQNTKYLIINSDITQNLNFLEKSKIAVITYGLNRKATITISSIKDDNTLICIQRSIENINKKIIEEQEVSMQISKNNINKTYNMLAVFTILSIFDNYLKKIEKNKFLCRQIPKNGV